MALATSRSIIASWKIPNTTIITDKWLGEHEREKLGGGQPAPQSRPESFVGNATMQCMTGPCEMLPQRFSMFAVS